MTIRNVGFGLPPQPIDATHDGRLAVGKFQWLVRIFRAEIDIPIFGKPPWPNCHLLLCQLAFTVIQRGIATLCDGIAGFSSHERFGAFDLMSQRVQKFGVCLKCVIFE